MSDDMIQRVARAIEDAYAADGAASWEDMARAAVEATNAGDDAQIHRAFRISKAATDYHAEVEAAMSVHRVNGRRGASASAVEAVNRARARAKRAHDRLMQVIAEETSNTEPQP